MPPSSFAPILHHLANDGYAMLDRVYSPDEVAGMAQRITESLEQSTNASILKSKGFTYGSRNLIDALPEVAGLFDSATLRAFIRADLGSNAGVVRVLYFDKPPGRTWSLPWHKDRTIAVQRNDLPSENFLKPTTKARIPHVEAPVWLLERMLTLRIHVDAMTERNGPLRVLPGTHLPQSDEAVDPVELHAQAGDVLAMRPLLSHSSGMSDPEVTYHRRIVHIELSPDVDLPDGYQWHSFVSV